MINRRRITNICDNCNICGLPVITCICNRIRKVETKSKFIIGNDIYTYNQETKRYYLLDDSEKYNLTYVRYNYSTVEEKDNKMIIKNYVGYTDDNNTFSITLGGNKLNVVINNENIKDNISILKYYEYEFIKNDGKYILNSISIK